MKTADSFFRIAEEHVTLLAPRDCPDIIPFAGVTRGKETQVRCFSTDSSNAKSDMQVFEELQCGDWVRERNCYHQVFGVESESASFSILSLSEGKSRSQLSVLMKKPCAIAANLQDDNYCRFMGYLGDRVYEIGSVVCFQLEQVCKNEDFRVDGIVWKLSGSPLTKDLVELKKRLELPPETSWTSLVEVVHHVYADLRKLPAFELGQKRSLLELIRSYFDVAYVEAQWLHRYVLSVEVIEVKKEGGKVAAKVRWPVAYARFKPEIDVSNGLKMPEVGDLLSVSVSESKRKGAELRVTEVIKQTAPYSAEKWNKRWEKLNQGTKPYVVHA